MLDILIVPLVYAVAAYAVALIPTMHEIIMQTDRNTLKILVFVLFIFEFSFRFLFSHLRGKIGL